MRQSYWLLGAGIYCLINSLTLTYSGPINNWVMGVMSFMMLLVGSFLFWVEENNKED